MASLHRKQGQADAHRDRRFFSGGFFSVPQFRSAPFWRPGDGHVRPKAKGAPAISGPHGRGAVPGG